MTQSDRSQSLQSSPVVAAESDFASAGPVAAAPRWNAISIASFVTSLFGLSVVGVICGHIAWPRLARTSERGRGFAIAGLVLGYLGIAFWAAFWVFAFVAWGPFAGTAST